MGEILEGVKEGLKKSYSSKNKDHLIWGFPSDSVKNLSAKAGGMGSFSCPESSNMPQATKPVHRN